MARGWHDVQHSLRNAWQTHIVLASAHSLETLIFSALLETHTE
jgi:hypothetical protein